MKKEDMEFLKSLQQEMLTQDTVCQADPRFWVVMQTVRDYWIEDDTDGISIYDTYDAEVSFEGDLDIISDWLNKKFPELKCTYDGYSLNIICEDETEYEISDIDEIRGFLKEYEGDRYSVCQYKDREEIVENTMFLTLRECKEHIERNGYHYNKPHTYAMTAYRSPQVERLYKILQNTNWEEINK